ncbi:MAG: hypothetical protein WCV90_08810 [Candidatus Woesearchaeota archaeon]|jgi:hypothetical protein
MAKITKKEVLKPTSKSKNGKEIFYPAEEQGILPEETEEKIEEEMEEGEKETDIYSKAGRKVLEEEDEIEPWEQGFMEGAAGPGQLGKDALTGKPIMGADEVIELEWEGKMYRFVSQKNAELFLKKKKQEASAKKVPILKKK